MWGKRKLNETPNGSGTGKARALVVSLTHIDPLKHNNWDGRNGCSGCGIDAARISEILRLRGYEITSLSDERATSTNVLTGLWNAAKASGPGDTFLFFFAGHGAQQPDLNRDEDDEGGRQGSDETLVCFDGELIDDELDSVWLGFGAGSVIYMLSDSCNSGTNYRGRSTQGPTPIRPMHRRVAAKMKARLLHIGGCRDGFTSAGYSDGGLFTSTLYKTWDAGRGPGSWKALHEAICATVTGQAPQINTYGPDAALLLSVSPFSTSFPLESPPADNRSAGNRGQEMEDALNSGELTPTLLIPDDDSRSGTRADSLPINEAQARKVTGWLMANFGPTLREVSEGTPFGPELLIAIICQETAYFWLPLLLKLQEQPEFKDDPEELRDVVVARCVLDASGDYPGAPRSAFPKTTAEFRAFYREPFTSLLIEEANATRALRGYGRKEWVYKGYGMFQYDLQYVKTDEAFFRERRWYDFRACAENCIKELKEKFAAQGELWEAVRAYNGSGPRARQYRENVKRFYAWTKDEIEKMGSTRGAERARPILPSSKPAMKQADLAVKLAPFAIDRTVYPLVIVGIRGYYLDTMGKPGVNDRGIYDDAIFIDGTDAFASFNGNTDPSRYNPGYGTAEGTKGMANLKAGAWFVHKFDDHGSKVYGPYPAICQRLGKLTVIRDGNPPYEDTGSDFGINIHKGSYHGTSSLGCQTVHPDQWDSFYGLAKQLAQRYHGDRWKAVPIPYILIEGA